MTTSIPLYSMSGEVITTCTTDDLAWVIVEDLVHDMEQTSALAFLVHERIKTTRIMWTVLLES